MSRPSVASLHYELIHGLVQDGVCPNNAELAERMGIEIERVDSLLAELSGIHGVVLHPHDRRPWIVHPFSLTPTIHWVASSKLGWWAPCIWCAFGIATLVGGDVCIHSRVGAETTDLEISVSNGNPIGYEHVMVHFAIPPAHAWDNVHEHCSLVLPFPSIDAIHVWCKQHRVPFGEAVPLHQVAALARKWYGSHANSDWQKWSIAEAQGIFRGAGLTSAFWTLDVKEGKF